MVAVVDNLSSAQVRSLTLSKNFGLSEETRLRVA